MTLVFCCNVMLLLSINEDREDIKFKRKHRTTTVKILVSKINVFMIKCLWF